MSLAVLIARLARWLTPNMIEGVKLIVCAIAYDLAQARCCLRTRQAADGVLRFAHNLLGTAIHVRACKLAGVAATGARLPVLFYVARVSHRTTLLRRLEELLIRLERWRLHAQRLAEKLGAARCGHCASDAPHPVPAAAHPQPATRVCMRVRLTDRAPRDGPLLSPN